MYVHITTRKGEDADRADSRASRASARREYSRSAIRHPSGSLDKMQDSAGDSLSGIIIDRTEKAK